jgi:hypothetical protein
MLVFGPLESGQPYPQRHPSRSSEDPTTPAAFVSFGEMGSDTWDKPKYDGGYG